MFDAEFAVEDGKVRGLAFYKGFVLAEGLVHEDRGEAEVKDEAAVYFTKV